MWCREVCAYIAGVDPSWAAYVGVFTLVLCVGEGIKRTFGGVDPWSRVLC